MAKQIKVIQCPQCGSTKPEQIKPDHYRCDKCGTQFFLDNDDIHIHVNHNHARPETHRPSSSRGVWAGAGILLFIGIIFFVRFCTRALLHTGEAVATYRTYETPPEKRSRYLFSTLLPMEDKGVALVLENRGLKDSTFAIFRDVAGAAILSEQNLGIRGRNVVHRHFASERADYLIADHSRIYRVDHRNYALDDVTASICARKPALEAGLMSVDFVDEGTGEGFRMNTNLGKELFYFPASDVLCTEKAYRFMTTDNDKGLLPGAENRVYYLFLNRESAHSSNVARLMEITYLFNNGGPENRLREITGGAISDPEQHRIVSAKAITDEQACFSPAVLYSDDRNILISYRPSLAADAVVNLQLLDTAGKIEWTVAFTSDFECRQAVRTNRGYLLQTSENNFWEIGRDGGNSTNYKF